ncbi:MAG: universal stress protein [Solirubrobacterales bacterium]|nr:universal stress protein [Solirubrobacterales bacterium]
MANEIVVGYDGSDCSKAALDAAAKLATELKSKLVLVFGYEPYRVGGEIQDHRKALEERGEVVTSEGMERAKGKGAEAEVALVDRESVDALMSVADARDARMIVVGTYGEHPLKGAILGSTPYKLVQLSETPVLVVRG